MLDSMQCSQKSCRFQGRWETAGFAMPVAAVAIWQLLPYYSMHAAMCSEQGAVVASISAEHVLMP